MYRFSSFLDEHTIFLPKFNLDRIFRNKLGSSWKTVLEKIIGRCGWRAYIIIFWDWSDSYILVDFSQYIYIYILVDIPKYRQNKTRRLGQKKRKKEERMAKRIRQILSSYSLFQFSYSSPNFTSNFYFHGLHLLLRLSTQKW